MELLSLSTEAEDLRQTLISANKPPTKWQAYYQYLRSPYYVIFDRHENKLRAAKLAEKLRALEVNLDD